VGVPQASGSRRMGEGGDGGVGDRKARRGWGRYLQGHLAGVPMRPQVLQEAKGALPAALLLLILNRNVQLGHLRGARRDVDVIGHGPGDGGDDHDDDGDGDHENGGRRQAAGSFRPGAPSWEGWGRSDGRASGRRTTGGRHRRRPGSGQRLQRQRDAHGTMPLCTRPRPGAEHAGTGLTLASRRGAGPLLRHQARAAPRSSRHKGRRSGFAGPTRGSSSRGLEALTQEGLELVPGALGT
jgi:hypothetical protein